MKKGLSNLLIFICLFVVILGSSAFLPYEQKVLAADEGRCIYSLERNNRIETIRVDNVTQARCIQLAGTNPSYTWTPNSGGQTQSADAVAKQPGCGITSLDVCLTKALNGFLTGAVYLLLKLVGLLTQLGGTLLNISVKYTIIDMTNKFNETPGIGAAINSSWSTIRDLANMSFIFILLFSSIQLILGLKSTADTRKLIVHMVIAALLINFSLFFTKIFIDVSNIIALTFYEAIAPGAQGPGANVLNAGISNSLMKPLGLTSLFQMTEGGLVGTSQIITIGIMGSILLLIAAFVFFAIAMTLIIRYVILIFVLIFSPLAAIADIIPGAKTYFTQWKTALINQSFFPAIYFLLTWVTLKIFNSLPDGGSMQAALGGTTTGGTGGTNLTYNPDAVSTLIQFVVVIVFIVASLVIAKKMASQAAPGVDKMVNWATGKAGAATFGMAGRLGRGTIGRAGQSVADDKALQARALAGDRGARLKLWAAQKTGKASFDSRATGLSTTMGAGKAQSGGFAKDKKDKLEKHKELVKNIKDTDGTFEQNESDRWNKIKDDRDGEITAAKEQAQERVKNGEVDFLQPEIEAAKARAEELRSEAERVPSSLIIDGKSPEESKAAHEAAKAAHEAAKAEITRLEEEKKKAIKNYVDEAGKAREAELKRIEGIGIEEIRTTTKAATDALALIKRQRGAMIEQAARDRADKINNAFILSPKRVLGIFQIKREEQEAVAAIRKENRGKSLSQQAMDALKKAQKAEEKKDEENKKEEDEPSPSPSTPST